jgi:hypothetical protein
MTQGVSQPLRSFFNSLNLLMNNLARQGMEWDLKKIIAKIRFLILRSFVSIDFNFSLKSCSQQLGKKVLGKKMFKVWNGMWKNNKRHHDDYSHCIFWLSTEKPSRTSIWLKTTTTIPPDLNSQQHPGDQNCNHKRQALSLLTLKLKKKFN